MPVSGWRISWMSEGASRLASSARLAMVSKRFVMFGPLLLLAGDLLADSLPSVLPVLTSGDRSRGEAGLTYTLRRSAWSLQPQ
jgi:hypothetical protein